MYGALGSLGSRVEGARTVAGPATIILVMAYFASFMMIAQPTSILARAIWYFPLTAPMAMPGRIALGATAWWEPLIAAALTLAATVALVHLAGRVYTSAILRDGARLRLRDSWRDRVSPARVGAPTTTKRRAPALPGGRTAMTKPDLTGHRVRVTALVGIGIILGVAVAILTSDVILSIIAGAGFIAIAVQMVKLWTGHVGPPVTHH